MRDNGQPLMEANLVASILAMGRTLPQLGGRPRALHECEQERVQTKYDLERIAEAHARRERRAAKRRK